MRTIFTAVADASAHGAAAWKFHRDGVRTMFGDRFDASSAPPLIDQPVTTIRPNTLKRSNG